MALCQPLTYCSVSGVSYYRIAGRCKYLVTITHIKSRDYTVTFYTAVTAEERLEITAVTPQFLLTQPHVTINLKASFIQYKHCYVASLLLISKPIIRELKKFPC